MVKARRPPAVRDAALCGTGLLALLAAGFAPENLLEGADQRQFFAAPLAAAAAFVASKARRDRRPRAAGCAAGAAVLLTAAAALPTVDHLSDDGAWFDAALAPLAVACLIAAAFLDRPAGDESGGAAR